METPVKRYLVTAALPYANGKLHLGHLAGAYLPSDLYVRYLRSMKRDVVFLCGSDEHGVAITITADQEKTSPKAIVDRYHGLNKSAFEKFGMSFDIFSRTSIPLHHATAQAFFLKLVDAGILREKREKQLYDERAGMFLPDRYVEGTCPKCGYTEARGDQCERCGTFLDPLELINPKSKISGEVPVVRETTHLYFPLGDFQSRLEEYIRRADERDGWKENVLQYCRSWFTEGLADRAVTRDLQWGVPVPLKGFEQKVIYVWFDAVLGYISATKEWAEKAGRPEEWKRYWLDPSTKYVAFIGKDNVVFHCIVFPAMLMAWNDHSDQTYVLPENVPANEFLNFQGQKFSKSRGWGIDVDEFLAEFPADTLRYSLAMNMPELRDADFTWKDFQARTNNELADILGNFVNRTLTFVHRNFDGKVPPASEEVLSELGQQPDFILNLLPQVPATAGDLIEHYRFRDAVLHIMNLARAANRYFDYSQPWKTLISDRRRCETSLNVCLQLIRALAILLEPVTPSASGAIWSMLSLPGTPSGAGWESAGRPGLETGHSLGTPRILFTKIEDEVIAKHLRDLPTGAAPREPATPTGGQAAKPVIGIEQFRELDLRVAKVLAAERVPKSEKLLRLRVSLGAGPERQVIAGIAQHYTPEDLLGKKIVIVANLAPSKIMGQLSEGMLLAASDTGGKLAVLTVEDDLPEGSIVK